jgi:uncharacterized membrane protein YhaH (DUF805 family)
MTNLQVLFGFHGRIRRLQWWIGSLILFGLAVAAVFVGSLLVVLVFGGGRTMSAGGSIGIGVVALACYAMLIWGQLALGVKRLHDRDNSGWWLLLGFIPLANFALFIMLGFLDGTQGPNKHGPSPKGIGGRFGDRELGSVFS